VAIALITRTGKISSTGPGRTESNGGWEQVQRNQLARVRVTLPYSPRVPALIQVTTPRRLVRSIPSVRDMSLASPSQSSISTSGSGSTPTSASTSTVTPASYAASSTPTSASTSRRPYPLSASQLDDAVKRTGATGSQLGRHVGSSASGDGEPDEKKQSRIPVTPAVLRAIFASSRTPGEERSMSRVAFFRCVLRCALLVA
jgi:hypothetical protein